ncbi:DUF3304 domain-containing protein [Halopseudomonas pelagia]|uniref:DUF3304 domain-containing protein n=1 Tax=Halopseudomonas pelagia TaxID=553151 RepID=UPI00039EC82C|nr:DUF3304 domain-containing protein [Halopseudomonas pelagia]
MSTLKGYWRSLAPYLRWSLVVAFILILIGSLLAWQYQRPANAALYIHNHTDRPIFSYWVNDSWGGNAGANGGGKVTCCWRISGDSLKVSWIVSRTKTQAEQGLEEERHEMAMANPVRGREDHYLHVHFFPDNEVRMVWSPNHDSPYEHLKQARAQETKE